MLWTFMLFDGSIELDFPDSPLDASEDGVSFDARDILIRAVEEFNAKS